MPLAPGSEKAWVDVQAEQEAVAKAAPQEAAQAEDAEEALWADGSMKIDEDEDDEAEWDSSDDDAS